MRGSQFPKRLQTVAKIHEFHGAFSIRCKAMQKQLNMSWWRARNAWPCARARLTVRARVRARACARACVACVRVRVCVRVHVRACVCVRHPLKLVDCGTRVVALPRSGYTQPRPPCPGTGPLGGPFGHVVFIERASLQLKWHGSVMAWHGMARPDPDRPSSALPSPAPRANRMRVCAPSGCSHARACMHA